MFAKKMRNLRFIFMAEIKYYLFFLAKLQAPRIALQLAVLLAEGRTDYSRQRTKWNKVARVCPSKKGKAVNEKSEGSGCKIKCIIPPGALASAGAVT